MNYRFPLILFFFLFSFTYVIGQVYFGLNLGAGIAPSTQYGINIAHQSKNVSSLSKNIGLRAGYKFKRNISIESGFGINTYNVKFNFNPTIIGLYEPQSLQTYTPIQVPFLIKFVLNRQKTTKKKIQKYFVNTFVGATLSVFPDLIAKDNLPKKPIQHIQNGDNYEVRYYEVVSRIRPYEPTVLITSGIGLDYLISNQWRLALGLDMNIGFKPIVAAYIVAEEKINNSINNDVFTITSNSSYIALRLGVYRTF